MKITIQTNMTATEYGNNIFASDEVSLGEEDNGHTKYSYGNLAKIYDLVQQWPKAEFLAIPINGKLWSFNPANIVRVCITLRPQEERAYTEWWEKHNAR